MESDSAHSRERGAWSSQGGHIRDLAVGRAWGEWLSVLGEVTLLLVETRLLVFSETSQELLQASRFILGTSGRAFGFGVGGGTKERRQIPAAGGPQTPGQLAGL